MKRTNIESFVGYRVLIYGKNHFVSYGTILSLTEQHISLQIQKENKKIPIQEILYIIKVCDEL